ncbi:inner membrane protein [Escherichia coli]|nr:inner membrane protein [Escherichia coli]SQS32315.1 inner membrane protein [Escherichia coli]
MREQIKQDIDLIEILFYLKKKIRVILFIMAICMAMVLLFLYINKDNIKVIGNDSNLLIVFYVQIMPDDFVMQLHRF